MTKIQNNSKEYFWPVQREVNVNLSKTEVWKIISSESNLELFHPFVKENKIISWTGRQSEDILIYLNGRTMKRKFVFWEENFGYDLFINQAGFEPSFVSWRVIGDNQRSIITISIWPYLFNKGNKAFNYFPFQLFVRPSLEKYLFSVLRGLKYFLENDKVVKKNQFGKHAWFSA